jgi:N-acetylglucosamine kinase-like BadF-type ATPase
MKYVFGIDGGGTSSRLRIESEEGGLLFYREAGSTNPSSNSWDSVESVLGGLFQAAFAEAKLRPEDCLAGFAGTAGVDRTADREPFAAILRKASRLSCPLGVGNDAEPALAGAIGDIEGLLLIAGPGSIAFDAIARSLRSREGRDLPTGLLEAGIEFFGLREAMDFVPFIYAGPFDKTKIARFSRVVAEYRDRGDALAVDLFDEAGRELEALVLSVERRLGSGLKHKRLALRGGLIENNTVLREGLGKRLAGSAPEIEIVAAKADAASGACILARSLIQA